MSEKKSYKPSTAEIQNAENMMTEVQKKLSALRERKLAELNTGETEIIREERRGKMIKALQGTIDMANVRIKTYQSGGSKDMMHGGGSPCLLDCPKNVQSMIRVQLEKLTQKREELGLPALFYNPVSNPDVNIILNGRAFSKHAKSFEVQNSGYGTSFDSIAMHPMCVVTTENSPVSEKTGAYKPEGAVLVFTHPIEVVRQLSRYVEDIKKGNVDEFPAAAIVSIEDFVSGIESGKMPGDPKKK